MTRNDTHIPFLDHIRGIAVLIVFLFHCLGIGYGYDSLKWNGWFYDFNADPTFLALLPLTFGWVGVAIFFVVSGFCIHLSYERSRDKSNAVFFLRRFFRIYPPYLVALLIFSCLPPWHYIPFNTLDSLVMFGSHMFLVHNFDAKLFSGICTTFWSVAIEFQLYLIYPILIWFVRKLSWTRTLLILGVVEIAMRSYDAIFYEVYGTRGSYWIIGSPLYYWFSWSIGAAAADAFLLRRELPFAKVPPSVFLILMVITANIRPLSFFAFIFAALATICIMDRLLKGEMKWTSMVPKWIADHLRFAGLVSYSIYLLHFPVLTLVPRVMEKFFHGQHFHPLVMMLACVATWIPVLAASWVFYRIFEMPSIALGKKVIRHQVAAKEARQLASGDVAPDA
ncbi:MAG: acyltransferase [Luteolibacter sp.]|uniref:acyltransferase family protein n=1 Tax=Luteolibacter sp. TaxID=1962973 RepID=UPI003265D5CA